MKPARQRQATAPSAPPVAGVASLARDPRARAAVVQALAHLLDDMLAREATAGRTKRQP